MMLILSRETCACVVHYRFNEHKAGLRQWLEASGDVLSGVGEADRVRVGTVQERPQEFQDRA